MLIFLVGLSFGVAIGWYAERLLKLVTILIERKPIETGVARRELRPGAQIQTSGIVKPKSPKEVAAEQDRKFREEFDI